MKTSTLLFGLLALTAPAFSATGAGEEIEVVAVNVNSPSPRTLQPLSQCGIKVSELAGKNAREPTYRTRQEFVASVPNPSAACRSMMFKLSDNDSEFRLPSRQAQGR